MVSNYIQVKIMNSLNFFGKMFGEVLINYFSNAGFDTGIIGINYINNLNMKSRLFK